jgi:hypothetical protein
MKRAFSVLSHGDNGNIVLQGRVQCWVKNVDSSHWLAEGVNLVGTYQAEVRDSYLHNGCWPVTSSGTTTIGLRGVSFVERSSFDTAVEDRHHRELAEARGHVT